MGCLSSVEAESYDKVKYSFSDYRWLIQELYTTGIVAYSCQVIIHGKGSFSWDGCEASKRDYEQQPYESKKDYNVMQVVYAKHA